MLVIVSRIKRAMVVSLLAPFGLVSFMGIGGLAGWVEPFWEVSKVTVVLTYGVLLLILMAWPMTWIQEQVLRKLLPVEDIAGNVGACAAFGAGVILLPVFVGSSNMYDALLGVNQAVDPLIELILASAPLSALISAIAVGTIVRVIRLC